MRDFITFKGVNSGSVGIVVTDLPEFIVPEERVTFTDVPGRNGSLTKTEGKNVYRDVTFGIGCYCADPEACAQAIAEYFRGAGELRLPNREGGYFEARCINQIEFQKILRGRNPRSFTVNFRRKPLFHLDAGEIAQTITSGDSLLNPSGIEARPVITILGSGDITLLVGDQIITLEGIETGIILDSELQEAYYSTTLKNNQMTGAFPVLGEGTTAISWTVATGGSVTSVSVVPRWVTL